MPEPNYQGPGKYRHYKGGEYQVLGLAIREETAHKEGPIEHALKACSHCGSRGTERVCGCGHNRTVNTVVVIYRPLTPGSMLEMFSGVEFWERTLTDFNGQVWATPGINVPRFERLPDPPVCATCHGTHRIDLNEGWHGPPGIERHVYAECPDCEVATVPVGFEGR